MARVTPSDVQPGNPVLTGLSVAYMQTSGFIARDVAAIVPVDKDEGSFYKWGAANFFRREDVYRATGGKYNRSGLALEKVNFSTKERGHEVPLDDDVVQNADSQLAIDKIHSERAAALVLLEYEDEVQGLIQTSGSYASGHTTTLSGTDQWSDLTNSDPIGDVITGMETVRGKTGRYPDTGVMSAAVYAKLIQHSQIIERVKSVQRTGTGDITEQLIAGILGLKRVKIAQPIEITSKEGATNTYADLWNDSVALLITDEPTMGTKNFAVTWSRWGSGLIVTESYREEQTRSEIYRARAKYDPDVISDVSGYLIIDTLA